jgi:hypothetical protein
VLLSFAYFQPFPFVSGQVKNKLLHLCFASIQKEGYKTINNFLTSVICYIWFEIAMLQNVVGRSMTCCVFLWAENTYLPIR